MINKAGGTSGKGTKNYRVSIPVDMVRALGITEEDRGVLMTLEGGKIIIEKDTKPLD
jgi:hypothetical protein